MEVKKPEEVLRTMATVLGLERANEPNDANEGTGTEW